ncbi:hypothetical protein J4464_05855 [Candidatus Woesearchaeota archaeon]|nr:hypothetical protein [Candidatus Woesearchaeota archaeon]
MHPKSLDAFRTPDYRVFSAGPYFNVDLPYEVKWHRQHLKTLKKHAKKPRLFFKARPGADNNERHFQEHVIESIPFHEQMLRENTERLATIRSLVRRGAYKKLVRISRTMGGVPEYFVYDKRSKKFFFVAMHLSEERRRWIHIVQDVHKLCAVQILT